MAKTKLATTKPSSPSLTFAQCAIGSKDRIWVLVEEDDEFHVLQLRQNKWALRTVPWPAASICGRSSASESFEVLVVGTDGELLTGIPGGFSETTIDANDDRTTKSGVLRDICFVGSDVFAAGMSRQIYRRRERLWEDISIPVPKRNKEIAGINSVHGLTADEVYAVGYNGEIWFYDSVSWVQVSSPTNVALNAVRVTPAGEVIACGAAGVILKGDRNGFVSIAEGATTDNLYGIAYFKGQVYLAALAELYSLTSSALTVVDFGVSGKITTGSLDANDGVLWSVGAKHIFSTVDGRSWSQVFCDL